jgi:MFS family permease
MTSETIVASERSSLLPTSDSSSTLTQTVDTQPVPLSRTRGILIIVSLFILVFILTSNISLLTTIQSPIANELEAFASVSWFASAYLIAITSITPVAGRLCLVFTPRIYLFGSITLQSVGLLITSSAPKLWVFLVGRVITGIGSAAVTPVALLLVTELTDEGKKGLFFGLVNTGYTMGVSLGAIIAGALEPAVGWRAVFWLQIPLTLGAATVALFAIPKFDPKSSKLEQDSSMGEKLSRIDYFGILTLISSVVLLLYSLSSPKILVTPIVLSALMLTLFVFVELKWAVEPIIPYAVLRSKGNILTGLATIGLMSARWGILFYSPVYAIAVRGWSQASAGLMLLPTNTGFAFGGIIVGWLHISKGGAFYVSSLATYVLFSLSLVAISQIATLDSNIWVFILALFVNGLLTGALLNYTLVHVLYLTLPATHVIVLPLNAMFRSLSGSFGASIFGGIFLRTLRGRLIEDFKDAGLHGKGKLIDRLVGTPRLVKTLTGIEKEIALDGYVAAIKAIFVAGAVLALFMTLFQAFTGWTAPTNEDGDDVLSNAALSPTVSRDRNI